jgi:hypothetical protein
MTREQYVELRKALKEVVQKYNELEVKLVDLDKKMVEFGKAEFGGQR